jgi:hypothetical protein
MCSGGRCRKSVGPPDFPGKEPHNELIVRPSGERDCRSYAKPSVAMVGSSIAEVIANPLLA